jgi:Holliday junction resolvase-like predicted endonuclease
MERVAHVRAGIFDRVLAGLDWVAARRGRTAATPVHLQTGIDGEDAACSYLRRKGYIVVARRWSGGNLRGDLDLIAWQGRLLCLFCRGKDPHSARYGACRSHGRHSQAQYFAATGATIRAAAAW